MVLEVGEVGRWEQDYSRHSCSLDPAFISCSCWPPLTSLALPFLLTVASETKFDFQHCTLINMHLKGFHALQIMNFHQRSIRFKTHTKYWAVLNVSLVALWKERRTRIAGVGSSTTECLQPEFPSWNAAPNSSQILRSIIKTNKNLIIDRLII